MTRARPHLNQAGARQRRALWLFIGLFLLFFSLSLVIHSPTLLELDLRFTSWLQRFRQDWLDAAARGVTGLGNTLPLIVLGLVTGIFLLRVRLIWAGVFTALIPPVVLTLNVLIKELIGRPRPEDTVVHQLLSPIGLSFPSGHAMVPMVFFGFLGLMAWTYLQPGLKRTLGVVLTVLLVVLIGLSRVYLGVHWLSDVIGGWTGGLLMLILTDLLYQKAAVQQLTDDDQHA